MATHRFGDWRVERKRRQEARIAELDRQDREAAERLHNVKPPPLFTEAAVDGACPKCHGRQFREESNLGAFLVGGVIAYGLATADGKVVGCVTCGERFRKG